MESARRKVDTKKKRHSQFLPGTFVLMVASYLVTLVQSGALSLCPSKKMGDHRATRMERELRQLSDALRTGDADVPNEGIYSRALLDAASLSSGQRVEARAKRSEIWRPAEVQSKQKNNARASTVRVASSVGRFLACHSTAHLALIHTCHRRCSNHRAAQHSSVFSARRRSFAFRFSPPHPRPLGAPAPSALPPSSRS